MPEVVVTPGHEAKLAQRALTKRYNAPPTQLGQAHEALDAAVAAASGWADCSAAIADDECLRRLLALNLARSGPP